MKISKKKLLEIIKEECECAMKNDNYLTSNTASGKVDKEGLMAKRQLSDIAEYAEELSGLLEDETQLESWVQAKLTKAADYIKTVKHYVEYGMEEGAYEDVQSVMPPDMESTVSLAPPVSLDGPAMTEIPTMDGKKIKY
jgi:hypothetical protein